MKIKESEKIDKYWDLAREPKEKLKYMRVTVILIVNGTLGAAPKVLEKKTVEMEISGRIETIQIITLLEPGRLIRRILDICRDLQSPRHEGKPCTG